MISTLISARTAVSPSASGENFECESEKFSAFVVYGKEWVKFVNAKGRAFGLPASKLRSAESVRASEICIHKTQKSKIKISMMIGPMRMQS